MSEISSFIESIDLIKDKYEILTVSHPKIEENYGTISILKIKLDNPNDEPLVVFCGYSNNSFQTGLNILMKGIDHLKKNYSVIYVFCWGSTLKTLSETYAEHAKNQEEKYKLNDELKIKLANVIDKILRSPEMDLKNFTLLAKSAGAGLAIFVASINMEIKKLCIACPGITAGGKPLDKRIDLPIKMSWNRDDDKLPYIEAEKVVSDFIKQKNNLEFISYEKGGHEFNIEFIKLI